MKFLSIFIFWIFLAACSTQTSIRPSNFCQNDADCVPAACCHASECTAAGSAPDCREAICTLECQAGTTDCGGGCLCINNKCSAQVVASHTKESCEAAGGNWQRRYAGEFCNFPAGDAGKPCTSSEECEGKCIGANPSDRSGKCSEYKTVFGCVTLLEDGQPRGICID